MRTPIIVGNWKLNKVPSEAVALAQALKKALKGIHGVEMGVAPTFVALPDVARTLRHTGIQVAAQNLFWEDHGAFTGEISASMLRDLGIQRVIIGHSERRQYFGETDHTVAKRLKAALDGGLKPIMCIGETLEQREANQTFEVLRRQLLVGLEGVDREDAKPLVIAYEPVWAIGTGRTATPEQAQEVHAFLRSLLKERYGDEIAQAMRIQYGGSVKPNNARELLSQPDIDGALVGGASLQADSFTAIVRAGLR